MTKNEFMRKLQADPKWAPGWDAIEAEFARLYPGTRPEHFGTAPAARAALGGDQYLDGYSFYASSKGYLHIVTFGLSELYGTPKAFGGVRSGKGCELTMKVKEPSASEALWACDILSVIASLAYAKKRRLSPYQILLGDELGISADSASPVKAVLLIPDTEAHPLHTVYGEVQFLQVLGLTKEETALLLAEGSVESSWKQKLAGSRGDGIF